VLETEKEGGKFFDHKGGKRKEGATPIKETGKPIFKEGGGIEGKKRD